MTNYGFEHGRSATMPGVNGKLSEVGALMALRQARRNRRDRRSSRETGRALSPAAADYGLQPAVDHRQAMQFIAAAAAAGSWAPIAPE